MQQTTSLAGNSQAGGAITDRANGLADPSRYGLCRTARTPREATQHHSRNAAWLKTAASDATSTLCVNHATPRDMMLWYDPCSHVGKTREGPHPLRTAINDAISRWPPGCTWKPNGEVLGPAFILQRWVSR
jgi:hypothetical protein